jgi:hypothetical protein
MSLLAATFTERVIDFLLDLAVKSRCQLTYLSTDETHQLSWAGLSSREQVLLGILRNRFYDSSAGPTSPVNRLRR